MNNSRLNNYSRPQIERIELSWGGVVLCASNTGFESTLQDWEVEDID